MKEPKKISASPEQKFCSWLEMQLVVTCTKVCELLPGRVLSTELCFGSQTRTLDRYREVTLGFTPFPRTGHTPGGTPGELPACAATPWCLSLPVVPQLSTERGSCSLSLSLRPSALVSHHESPITQGGILKQLAVKIGNKSLPFSLLEPSFLKSWEGWILVYWFLNLWKLALNAAVAC